MIFMLLAACGGDGSAPSTPRPPLDIVTATIAGGTVGIAYSAALAASGGTGADTWSIQSGSLPAGLSLASGGTIAGTPTAPGTAALVIAVRDSGSPAQTTTKSFSLVIAPATLTIETPTLAAATVSTSYTLTLNARGGTGSDSWNVQSGTLPAGLSLSSAGVLSGMPTVVGITTFTLAVHDAGTPQQTATQTYNLPVAASGAAIQLTLATAPSSITIGSSFAGLSYEKNTLSKPLFGPDNTSLIALFHRLGPSLLRIGGNSVDHTLWNATGSGETEYQVSPPDLTRLAGFLRAAHWQTLYGIEFLNEAASPVAVTDPNLVGEEAVAAMQSLGDSLYGFEIGNEPDLYSNQISGYTYADFQAQWVIYRNAILSAVAAAKAAGTLPQSATPRFTGPAAAYNQTGYVNPFAAAEAENVFLLTRHYYRANGQSATSTMNLLLTPDPDLPAELAAMQTAASGSQISSGYRLSEANSFYNGGAPGISDGFGTSLWAINFLFTNAWAGSSGVNFHGGGDGPGYTPIADNGSAAVEARPEYYGLYLFSQAATGNLITTTLAPASTSLYAYAVTDGSGTSIVLVNTSATTASNVNVAFNGSVSSASFVALTGPNLNATTGQLLNGAAIAADGTWTPLAGPALPITGGTLQVPVPAGSALLLIAK
jgi:hypothetical protein